MARLRRRGGGWRIWGATGSHAPSSLYDLRQGRAVLVGYFHTRWKQLSKELRFYIDLIREPLGVLDNDKPTNWKISHHTAESGSGEDYAIVSRVFHPDTRNMLVGISGITGYGTEAASDLVTIRPCWPMHSAIFPPAGRTRICKSCCMSKCFRRPKLT